jgi:hypothetical protein
MTPAVLAMLVYGACGFLAATAVRFVLRAVADNAGVNPLIFIAVPGLFAMLYALLLYQTAQRQIRSMRESLSRGILIALLTWASFSLMASTIWCNGDPYGQCLSHTLLASAILGGGPMLLAALAAGLLVGVLILGPARKIPAPRPKSSD